MTPQTNQGFGALTEKEKQTLRLIVRGHDAKSIARTLDLSVHTINERLRDARRKMAVSSSREAARLLLDREAMLPILSGTSQSGRLRLQLLWNRRSRRPPSDGRHRAGTGPLSELRS